MISLISSTFRSDRRTDFPGFFTVRNCKIFYPMCLTPIELLLTLYHNESFHIFIDIVSSQHVKWQIYFLKCLYNSIDFNRYSMHGQLKYVYMCMLFLYKKKIFIFEDLRSTIENLCKFYFVISTVDYM